MSFAAEMAQYKATPGKDVTAAGPAEAGEAPQVTLPTSQLPTSQAQEAPTEAQHVPKHGEAYDDAKFDFNSGLPTGNAPVDPAAAKAAGEVPAPKAAEAPQAADPGQTVEPKKAPIKIGTREFQTIDDAVEYAKQLEAEKAQNDAFVEGFKEASKKPAVPETPKKTAYEIFSEKVFEDPALAAKDFAENLKAEIRQEYNTALQQQQQAEQRALLVKKTQEDFYSANPDLSAPEMREYLQETLLPHLLKNGKIKQSDTLETAAAVVRKQLEAMRVATLPTKELPSGPVTMAGVTGEATREAAKVNKEEVVDMVTALNRMRRRST